MGGRIPPNIGDLGGFQSLQHVMGICYNGRSWQSTRRVNWVWVQRLIPCLKLKRTKHLLFGEMDVPVLTLTSL